MTYEADHERIRQFSNSLKDLTDDADAAFYYVKDHLSIGYDEGRMFFTFVETADQVRDALEANYKHLSTLISSSSTELAKAADFYKKTDVAAAERLDRTYKK